MGALRSVVVSTGTALAVTALVATAGAEPAPSARDVQRSKQEVRQRADQVGDIKVMLAQANGELERLAVQAEAALERYNGELVKQERARLAYVEAQRKLAEAEQRYEEARTELAAFAAQAYRVNTGYNPWSAAVGGSGGPQGFMDRAGMVEMLAKQQAGAMDKVKATKNVADLFRQQAQSALKEQEASTKRAAEAKRAVETAVEKQRSAVRRIAAQKQELERRLGAARAQAESLERRRQAALEAAAAARAARAYGGSGRTLAGLGKSSARGAIVVRAALKWLGTPYSWGGGTAYGPSYGIAQGSGIRGFDCSGLALYAWNKVGVRLDHWTGTQWTAGPHVPISMLRPGDLVFFASNTGDPDTIHHVGIFLGRGQMVEAPYTGARVRISTIWRSGLIGATRPAG